MHRRRDPVERGPRGVSPAGPALIRELRCGRSGDVPPTWSTAATSGASSGFSMSPASSAAMAASPRLPSAAPWSMARTVSSRIPVRAARSRISTAQAGVCGCPWRRPISHRASRMWTSSHTYRGRPPDCTAARVEEAGDRPVGVSRGLGDQRQPPGRDPLPARVADLAGTGERLLEAVGGGGEVPLGQQHLTEQRLRPGQEGQPVVALGQVHRGAQQLGRLAQLAPEEPDAPQHRQAEGLAAGLERGAGRGVRRPPAGGLPADTRRGRWPPSPGRSSPSPGSTASPTPAPGPG